MRTLSLMIVALLAGNTLAQSKDVKEPEWLAKVRAGKLDEIQTLQLKQHDALVETLALQTKFIQAGSWDVNALSRILDIARKIVEVRMELAPTPADRITALQEVHQSAKSIEDLLKARVNAGSERKDNLMVAVAATLEIEILIAKEKKKLAGTSGPTTTGITSNISTQCCEVNTCVTGSRTRRICARR